MSAVTKFANLRSPLVPVKPITPEITLYTRTIDALEDLRAGNRITSDEADKYFDKLQDAQWEQRTIESIQSVRDEIAKAVR